LYPRLLQLGHLAIPTYGALTALALIAGLAAAVHFAGRLGVNPNKIWSLCLMAILTTLIGARLLLVISNLDAFKAHPFWLLGLTNIHNQWVTVMSLVAGVGAAILYALAEGIPVLGAFDCLAPAAAVAVTINRVGAFLAGLDYGAPTTVPWAVTYKSLIAAFWYRTPIGIGLHPVQLYEAAASLVILAVLVWWLPRRSQSGELAGAWLFLFGVASFFLGFYRAGVDGVVFSEGIAAVSVIAGGALWVKRAGSREQGTGVRN
jgi:phosphatidylglycerol---prolipoprotein diacylglyceryl transferase